MRDSTQDAFVGAAVIVVLALILIVGLRHFDRDIPHQDVNCFTESGDELLWARDVTVVRTEGAKFVFRFPDGRTKVYVSGVCEYAPHDPEGDYAEEEIQSWQGPPEDRTWRNA